MKKISIIKNNQITNQAQFANDELLNEWLNRETLNGSFGKPEHQVLVSPEQTIQIEAVLDEQGNELEPARTEVIEAVYETIPSEFTVEIEDISSEIERQNKLKQISDLESQITPRRMREAMLSNDFSFIESIESQIQVIRSSL